MDRLPPGPYRQIPIRDGVVAPWFVIPFDKNGVCEAPLTYGRLINDTADGRFSDVFVFSHGWNNDWKRAIENYERFIEGMVVHRRKHGLKVREDYKPLLVAIFWPSIDLVLPWEKAPGMAGATPNGGDLQVDDESRQIQEIAGELKSNQVARFYELVRSGERINRDQALELAEMLLAQFQAQSDEVLGSETGKASSEDLVRVWSRLQETSEASVVDGSWGTAEGEGVGPMSAGGFGFDPRDILRLITVYKMKDRAGTVGALGVGPLVRDLLRATEARLHLVGHSYGCKVLLSALCSAELPRSAESLLLLQAAVNHLCFAADVPGLGRPGGYRGALRRVEQPILSTFSSHDAALHRFFHLAVRRASDVGEMKIAGALEIPKFAALGGYGPGVGSAAE